MRYGNKNHKKNAKGRKLKSSNRNDYNGMSDCSESNSTHAESIMSAAKNAA